MNVCVKCDRKGCGSYHDICPEYQAEKREQQIRQEKKDKEQFITTALFEQKDKAIRQKLHGRRAI